MQVFAEAVWFGVEKEADGQWFRCSRDGAGKNQRWWKIAEVQPQQIAPEFGPGNYRALWAAEDRRKQLGHSEPFQVAQPSQPDGGASFDGLELVDLPPRPAPPPAPVAAMPPQPGVPATVTGNAPWIPPTTDPDLQRLMTLHGMMYRDFQLTIERERQSNAAAIESERARAEAMIEQTRLFFATIEQQRQQMQSFMMTIQGNAETKQVAALQAMHQQLMALGQKVEQLEVDDDDADAQAAMMLGQASQDPSDRQQLMQFVAALVNSPVGQAAAEALKQKAMGGNIKGAGGQPSPDAEE